MAHALSGAFDMGAELYASILASVAWRRPRQAGDSPQRSRRLGARGPLRLRFPFHVGQQRGLKALARHAAVTRPSLAQDEALLAAVLGALGHRIGGHGSTRPWMR